jgi:hypothetical protein
MLLSGRRSRSAATLARWWTDAGMRSVTRTSESIQTASARNPHAILFAWNQSRAYRQLRDLLSRGSATPPPPHQPAPPTWQPSGWPPERRPFTHGE